MAVDTPPIITTIDQHPKLKWSAFSKLTGLTAKELRSELSGLGYPAASINSFLAGKTTASQLNGGPSPATSVASGVSSAASSVASTVTGGISSIGTVLGDLTNIDLWKGLGLILAGGLILIFAAYEFAHMAGVSPPKVI